MGTASASGASRHIELFYGGLKCEIQRGTVGSYWTWPAPSEDAWMRDDIIELARRRDVWLNVLDIDFVSRKDYSLKDSMLYWNSLHKR